MAPRSASASPWGAGHRPNTGLLLVLLAVAFWPLSRRPAGVASHDHGNAPVMAEQEMA